MKQFISKFWPIFFIGFIWLIFIWPFWLKGLIPAPLDFLVSFFSPWQGFYNLPIKNPAIPDVVNQIIPWKLFTISQWRQGIIPLWNPYNFAGAPHAANWQSAVFYPLNALMLLFDFTTGWSLYVLFQPLLAGIFTYFYARVIKLSPQSSLLAALSFAFSGFLTSWLEWGTLGHAILWLPLSLWSIEKYLNTDKKPYFLINIASLSLSLLAGHLQISLYVIIASFAYLLYRLLQRNSFSTKTFFSSLILYALPFLLIAFQFFMSLELYINSPRATTLDFGWFDYFRIPLSQLITFIAPDFFGNPATGNHWGDGSYVEMMGYIGLVPLLLSFTAIISWLKTKTSKVAQISFFLGLTILSLLLSLKTPFANLLFWLKLPVFASSSPARIIGLVSFSLSILAAIGLESITKPKTKFQNASPVKPISILGTAAFVCLWLAAFFLVPQDFSAVAQRNLILPTVIFAAFVACIHLFNYIRLKKILPSKTCLLLTTCFIFLLSLFDLYRFHHKFTPYTSRDYFYPNFGIRRKLAELSANADRSFGLFDAELNLPFNLAVIGGYDPLHPAQYAKLASTHRDGTVNLPARPSGVSIAKNDPYTIPILNLTSSKYVIQPTVHGAAPWELHLWEYPDQFEKLYDDGNYQIFQNHQAFPRFFLTTDFVVEPDSAKIIPRLLKAEQPNVWLQSSPRLEITDNPDPGTLNLTHLSSQKISLATNTAVNSLLYLSDNYYPGWHAYIDSQPASILKANYAFKAIPVPQGNHQVDLEYRPLSFTLGVVISLLSLIALLGFTFILKSTYLQN